jgi:hypothetical protein
MPLIKSVMTEEHQPPSGSTTGSGDGDEKPPTNDKRMNASRNNATMTANVSTNKRIEKEPSLPLMSKRKSSSGGCTMLVGRTLDTARERGR